MDLAMALEADRYAVFEVIQPLADPAPCVMDLGA